MEKRALLLCVTWPIFFLFQQGKRLYNLAKLTIYLNDFL